MPVMIKRSLPALVLALAIGGTAFAQSAEFGRVSGGQIELATKSPSKLSGSLSFTLGTGLNFGATAGGTIVKDRLWFFGSAQQNEPRFSAPMIQTPRFDAKLSTQMGNRNDFGASFNGGRDSFLSMRYTGIVSSNMFITATVSRTSPQ